MSLFYNTSDTGDGGGGVTIVDDFEDGDISEYSIDGAGTNTGTQTTTVQEGTTALQVENVSGQFAGLHSTSGLNTYPSPDDTFRCWARLDGGRGPEVRWAVQAETGVPDCYAVFLDNPNNEFEMRKYSGSRTIVDKAATTINIGTWYDVEIEWPSSGDITATLFDSAGSQLAQVSTTGETEFTTGGIGFSMAGANGGELGFFDYYRIV